MKRKLSLATSLAVALAGGTAFAQSGSAYDTGTTSSTASGTSGDLFSDLDTDRDGSVTRAEARKNAGVSRRFKDLDANKNGKLSANEVNTATAEPDTATGGSTTGASGSDYDTGTPSTRRTTPTGKSAPYTTRESGPPDTGGGRAGDNDAK